MLYLNANEEKRLVFEVDIHGVESKELHGSVRFILHGVEYGFPAEIDSKKITALVPPLTEVIGKEIEDGTVLTARLDLFTDRHYFRPWEGDIKLGAPMQIKAKLESEDKSKVGIRTKLVTPVIAEEKKEKVSESDSIRETVYSILKEFDLKKNSEPKNEKVSENIKKTTKKKVTNENVLVKPKQPPKKKPTTVNEFMEEKMMSGELPKNTPQNSVKKIKSKQDILNMSEQDVYAYMSRAGTKNPKIQQIIYEQAAASAGSGKPIDVLKEVIKILNKKSMLSGYDFQMQTYRKMESALKRNKKE